MIETLSGSSYRCDLKSMLVIGNCIASLFGVALLGIHFMLPSVIIGKHLVACVCQVMLASMPTPPVAARWSKFFMNLCYWEPLILVHNLCQTIMQFAFDPQALERFYGVHQDRHESLAVVDLLGSALDDPEGAVDHFVVFP